MVPLDYGDWAEGNHGKFDVVVPDVRSKNFSDSKVVYESGHVPGAIYSSYLEKI